MFLAVLPPGHFHVVIVLDNLQHFRAHLKFVAELVADGLRQSGGAAHDIAGQTRALVPDEQEITYARSGGDFLRIARGTRDCGPEKRIPHPGDKGPVNSAKVLSAMKS